MSGIYGRIDLMGNEKYDKKKALKLIEGLRSFAKKLLY